MIEFSGKSRPRYAVGQNTDNSDWIEICDTKVPHINGIGTPIARVLKEPTLIEHVLIGLNYPYSLD